MKKIEIKTNEKIVVYTPNHKYTMIVNEENDDITMIAEQEALENIKTGVM